MKTLATIGDNCVDIYPQLNKAFSGGNAVNVAVYCTRYGIQPGCITWVGDDDYGTKLKQDPRPHGRRYQPCPYETRRYRTNSGGTARQ